MIFRTDPKRRKVTYHRDRAAYLGGGAGGAWRTLTVGILTAVSLGNPEAP